MTIAVKDLRLSLVWKKPVLRDNFLPEFADGYAYKNQFNLAKSNPNSGEWSLPWQPGEKQHFWQHYLLPAIDIDHTGSHQLGSLDEVEAERGWNFLIPFRAPMLAQIDPTSETRTTLEGFCSPHSVGVITTFFIHPLKSMTLADSVRFAIQAVNDTKYHVTWLDQAKKPQSSAESSLRNLAGEMINRLYQKTSGASPNDVEVSGPLTIATIIDASGVGTAGNVQQANALKRALWGLCRLKPGWEKEPMTGLIENENRMDPPETRLYAMEQGRAIWMPNYFTDALKKSGINELGPGARQASCYHRNLSMATLQAQSLIALVERVSAYLPNSQISLQLVKPVMVAIKILNSMYLGDRSKTYQSGSLKCQIEFYLKKYILPVAQAVGVNWVAE